MIQRFDLVIVGGSFAGLACARTAALRGLKVAVLDGKPEPGARVRTTGIVVKEASDDFDLPARLMRKVRGVRLYAPNDRSLDLSAPGYFFQATDTPGVLRWMAAEAERAGATLLYGRKFETAVEHERGVALTALGLHASFLIGADGARSRVAEHFGLGAQYAFPGRAGDRMRAADRRSIRVSCTASPTAASRPATSPGSCPAWTTTQIGVAARRPPGPISASLLLRLKTVCDIREIRVTSRRSGLIPSGGTLQAPGHQPGDAGRRCGRHGVAGHRRRHPHRAAFRPPCRASWFPTISAIAGPIRSRALATRSCRAIAPSCCCAACSTWRRPTR